MKNSKRFISITLYLVVIFFFTSCMSNLSFFSKKRRITIPSQETEITQLLSSFQFNFDTKSDKDQLYFISQKKKKNFVVLARILEKNREGKIKKMRFTLINSEGSYYEIDSITQPFEKKVSPSKNGRILLIDFVYKKRCGLPYVPKWKEYEIIDPKNYIQKDDVVIHSPGIHFTSLSSGQDNDERVMKFFEVGEHICEVNFK